MRILVHEYLSTGALGDVPGAESLAREGLAMLLAVLEDLAECPGVELVGLVDPSLRAAVLARVPDIELHLVGPGQEEGTCRRLLRACSHALIIAPEFDDLLARRIDWATEAGCIPLGPDADAIRLTADKFHLGEHLLSRGVATLPVRLLESSTCPWEFPVVVKPRYGAGAQDTYLIDNPDDYHRVTDSLSGDRANWIVQPARWGPEVIAASVAFLLGGRISIPLLPCKQEIRLDQGQFSYHGGRLPLLRSLHTTAITLADRAIRSIPGLRGYVGVDFLLLDSPSEANRGYVLEINPRLTTSYVGLRRLASCNLMLGMVKLLSGVDPGPVSFSEQEIAFLPDGTIL